ncbi:MAG: PASTA domain-containing protein, partial [Gemmatimonadota bacterium]
MICPKCGDVVYGSAAFCLRCGTMTARMRHPEPDTTLDRPSRLSLRIVAGILTAAAAVLIVTSVSLSRPGGAAVRYVPNVVGRSRADAEARLAKAGFECVIGQGELSNGAEAGAVIRQLPMPGTPTTTKKVTIVPSLGEGMMVPDVVGNRQDIALATLAEHSLTGTVVKSEPDTAFPAGLVTRSWPAAGVLTPEGTAVRLVVSTGSPFTTVSRVPDVIGKSGRQAKLLLRSAGLTYVVSTKRFSTSVPHGHVIWQRPGPGCEPSTDKKVRVVLSLGRGVRVPDIIGKSEEEASRLLTEIGLRVETSHQYASAQKGQVISSAPRAGETAPAGSSVTLGISRGLGYGLLTVEAEPGDRQVWVYVDSGQARGKCPITVRLPAG